MVCSILRIRVPLALLLGVAGSLGIGLPPETHAQVIPFTDEAAARGIPGVVYFGQWSLPWGAGVALNDLDGDGDADCVLTVVDAGEIRILENTGGGTFLDRSNLSLLPPGLEYCGVSVADYDGDGDLDLYFSGWFVANRLFRNDGSFLFTDVTTAAGVGNEGFTTGTCWGDYDGDGWLDLYVCNRTGSEELPTDTIPNELYRNLGDGTFTPVGPNLGVDDAHMTFGAMFFDHDLDGDDDLYLSNDKGTGIGTNHNRLFENQGGTFVEISVASGAGVFLDSMGLDTGDFDGDGDFDLYCSNVPQGNSYLRNEGNGTYTSLAALLGIAAYQPGWGVLFWDFDNDSWTDLFVANSLAPNRLFTHGNIYPAVDVAPLYAIDDAGYTPGIFGSSYCAATADIDLDGDLDLLVQTWNEPFALYINHRDQDLPAAHYLRIKPRQSGPNSFAVGAVVQIRRGPLLRREQIRAGRTYKSSSELVAHFGLGDSAALIDEVLVRWPDRRLTRLLDITVDQEMTIDREAGPTFEDCNLDFVPDEIQIATNPALDLDGNGQLDACVFLFLRGDGNGDGVLDLGDAVAVLAHLFSDGALPCADAADANDDGLVDIADPIAILGSLFSGAGALPAPTGGCGPDPTPDPLGCSGDPSC